MPERPDPPEAAAAHTGGAGTLLWLVGSGVVGGLCLAAVVALARDRGGAVPPSSLFVAAGLVVSVVVAIAIVGASRVQGVTLRASVALAAAFLCIALVKFTLGPIGLYQVNQGDVLDTLVDDPRAIVAWIAVAVFGLYLTAILLIAALFRRRAGSTQPKTALVMLWALLAIGGIVGGAIVTLPGAQYVDFVFVSAGGTAIAVLLFTASGLIAHAFRTTADTARLAGTASVYLSVIWLALGFLVLFHVLWIVFLLALVTIWPLRTVTPK